MLFNLKTFSLIVFWSRACFLSFSSYFLVFFYKFPPQVYIDLNPLLLPSVHRPTDKLSVNASPGAFTYILNILQTNIYFTTYLPTHRPAHTK